MQLNTQSCVVALGAGSRCRSVLECLRAKEGRREEAGSERERLASAQALKFELANALRCGELLLASDVFSFESALAADLSGRLDGLSGRLANEIAGLGSDATAIRRRI